MQKGDGPIVRITKETLRVMVEGNEKALKLIDEEKYKKAIQAYNKSR